MNLPHTRVSLALCLCLTAWQVPAFALSPRAATFDSQVTAGLPQAFTLESPDGGGADNMLVESRLDADVEFPDGSHATLYTGTINGRQAIFSRIGDVLDVSLEADPGDAPPASRQRRALAVPAAEPDDVITMAPDRLQDATAAAYTSGVPDKIDVWIFLHDKANEGNVVRFHNWYIGWWVKDMERSVKPGVPLKVHLRYNVEGVTNFDYHEGSVEDSLTNFGIKAREYLASIDRPVDTLTKFMLFVDQVPTSWDGAYGYASERASTAMASGTGPRHMVAHEVGHLLDAQHELAETRWCATNMKGYQYFQLSCRYYTKRNDEKIRRYVKARAGLE